MCLDIFLFLRYNTSFYQRCADFCSATALAFFKNTDDLEISQKKRRLVSASHYLCICGRK